MVTKSDAKFIKSLQLKKFRLKEKAFVVEGGKNVIELLHSDFQILKLLATSEFSKHHAALLDKAPISTDIVSERELNGLGFFKNNSTALAVAVIPEHIVIADQPYVLAFESVQDPGNLGTIIRTADWYGFTDIVCSPDTVDVYNPKVIAATMGSFCRVNVHYKDLQQFIEKSDLPVYGATLGGTSVHDQSFAAKGILLFGNESKGISKDLMPLLSHEVKIPAYGNAESLNVAIATAVICDNVRRMQI